MTTATSPNTPTQMFKEHFGDIKSTRGRLVADLQQPLHSRPTRAASRRSKDTRGSSPPAAPPAPRSRWHTRRQGCRPHPDPARHPPAQGRRKVRAGRDGGKARRASRPTTPQLLAAPRRTPRRAVQPDAARPRRRHRPPADHRGTAEEFHLRAHQPRAVEKEFDAGRYNIICATGELPPNLQGVWGGTYVPGWASDYTHNGNVPSAIAADLMGNMPELMLAYTSYIESLIPGARAQRQTPVRRARRRASLAHDHQRLQQRLCDELRRRHVGRRRRLGRPFLLRLLSLHRRPQVPRQTRAAIHGKGRRCSSRTTSMRDRTANTSSHPPSRRKTPPATPIPRPPSTPPWMSPSPRNCSTTLIAASHEARRQQGQDPRLGKDARQNARLHDQRRTASSRSGSRPSWKTTTTTAIPRSSTRSITGCPRKSPPAPNSRPRSERASNTSSTSTGRRTTRLHVLRPRPTRPSGRQPRRGRTRLPLPQAPGQPLLAATTSPRCTTTARSSTWTSAAACRP